MSIIPTQTMLEELMPAPPECLPNYDLIITEDDKPVDNIYSERQHRLLTEVLSVSWRGPGEGRPYYAATDVGVFYAEKEPGVVPDVFVSLDVAPLSSDMKEKRNRSYFIWVFGKPPDAVVEVVSNRIGGELSDKLLIYARIRVGYYIVWDPCGYLSPTPLQCFTLNGSKYVPCDPWFPDLELGVTTWTGTYDQMQGTWLRWCDKQGRVLQTGLESTESEKQRAESEKQRAETAEQRAETAEQRAEKLAEKLRSLGIDPDQA